MGERRKATIGFVMSFILDALRKSESSRLRQEHPSMFDARAVAARRPFPVWAVVLGLLLGLNLLVVLTVLLRQERATTVASGTSSPPAVSAPAQILAAPSAAAATATAAPVSTAPATATNLPATAAPPPATPPAAMPRTPPIARASTTGTVTRASAVGDGDVGPAAGRLPARTRDDLLADGAPVPEAALSLHVYDPDPAARFILLNGQRLREGDTAGNGLRVLDIVADGVVLDHRGNAFKVSIDP